MTSDTETYLRRGARAYAVYKLAGWLAVGLGLPVFLFVASVSANAGAVVMVALIALAVVCGAGWIAMVAVAWFRDGL